MRAMILALLCLALSHQTRAQVCEPDWLPGDGAPGISGTFLESVLLASADLDGEGPAPSVLLAGGFFGFFGNTSASGFAAWDGREWSEFCDQCGLIPLASAVFDDGDGPVLYFGGTGIGTWDGQSWSVLPEEFDGRIHAMTVFDDGDGPALIVAGDFDHVGTLPANGIARWNGQTWSSMGSGLSVGAQVLALAVFDDGNGPALYAGGSFVAVLGNNIARWYGHSWLGLDFPEPDGTDGPVTSLAVFDDGSGPAMFVGGYFVEAGGALSRGIARWDGSGWSAFGWGYGGQVTGLEIYNDGSGEALYATGDRVARWDGLEWSDVGDGVNGYTLGIAAAPIDGTEKLFVYGSFSEASGVPALNIAEWNGSQWSALGSGFSNEILTMSSSSELGASVLYAGGRFRQAGKQPANHVARWDGQSWSPLGSGTNGTVGALGVFDDGSGPALYAGGSFTQAGGQPANRIAAWDGQSWSPLGSGMSGPVYALAVFDDGAGGGPALYAGGEFTQAGGQPANFIAKWDGQSWSPLGSGMSGPVFALAVFDDGSGPALYAGGSFTQAGGQPASYIAKWDGQSWSPLGSGMNSWVYALAVFDDGSGGGPALYAGGEFTQAGGQPTHLLACWDGAKWNSRSVTALDVDIVHALFASVITGERLYIGGEGSVGAVLLEWDGSGVSEVGGLHGAPAPHFVSYVSAVHVFDPDGLSGPAAPRLIAGGFFTTAGDHVSAFFAQFGEDTNTWGQPTGGDFNLGSNWLCNRALSSFDNFIIDGTAAGYTFSNYGITLPGDPEPLRTLTMRARTDVVSPFNLRGQSFEITGGTSTIARPALTVGELPDLGAQLSIRNISATPASVSAASLTIADQPTVPGVASLLGVRDANAVLDIEGDAYIGRRGDSGELLVQSGATASLGGVISVGTEAGAGGILRVLGSGSTLLHSVQNRSMAIGQSGEGALLIGSGGSAQSLGRLDTLILGTNPSGVGSVEIAGASSSWSFDANRFIVGNRGAGSVLIRNGALLETESDFSVDLALQPGSTGVVELRDVGSRWVETGQSITVHEGGHLIIGDGATLAAPAINVRAGGMLEGDGAIGVGFFDAEVINLGDVAPRTESGDPATLTIQGDFRQLDALPGQPADRAGRLRLTLSETAASSLSVQGIADIRGGLTIDAPQGVTLDDAADLSFLNASFGVDGRFDVVFLAGQPRNEKGELLALAVQYPTARGSERGFGDTLSLTTIATVAIDVEGAVTQIDSTGLITDGVIADLNGDGLNDLALTVVDSADPENAPGSVVILYNGGDNAGEWQGFTSSVSYLVGANPSSIAAADLNNDALNDLAVTNAGDDTATVLAYAGAGLFTPSLLTATGAAPSAVVLADFDGDTLTDVAIAAEDDDTITVYRNAGGVGGAWTGVVAQAPIPVGSGPTDLALVDNDDDKDLDDIASINTIGNDLELLSNSGAGDLMIDQTIPVGLSPSFLLAADLDNDAAESLDLVTADAQGQSLSIVLNQTGPGYAPSVQIPLDFVPRFVAAADLDSDGDRDLAVLAESGAPSNEITVLRNDLTSEGDLILAQDAPIVLDAPIRFLIAGDIDNDGADDLIAITESALRGNGDEVVRFAPRAPCPGDANGDGSVDFTDLNAVLVGFGFSGDLPGDVTGDGLVNFEDLNAVLVAFGSSCR